MYAYIFIVHNIIAASKYNNIGIQKHSVLIISIYRNLNTYYIVGNISK